MENGQHRHDVSDEVWEIVSSDNRRFINGVMNLSQGSRDRKE